jgi:hypothetical protein
MQGKRSLGFAHLFRPRYAGANLGHPSIPSERGNDTAGDGTTEVVP